MPVVSPWLVSPFRLGGKSVVPLNLAEQVSELPLLPAGDELPQRAGDGHLDPRFSTHPAGVIQQVLIENPLQ